MLPKFQKLLKLIFFFENKSVYNSFQKKNNLTEKLKKALKT